MLIDYAATRSFTQTLDLVDLGNAGLRCYGTMGRERLEAEYYVIIKTIMGKTSILKFGPIEPDLNLLVDGFKVEYSELDYKESKIIKSISTYINDPMKGIDKIETIEPEEALELMPDFIDAWDNL